MITANGQALEVLGSVKIHVMWKGTSVSKIPPEVRCYVVRDLEPAMLFGSNHIAKFRLRESPALQAAILLGGRSQQQRDNDVRRSQQIAALATANEQLEAERRRAERANLEQLAAPVDNTQMPGVTMNSMMSGRSDSLLGGSCTSASSPKSSSTGFDSGMATTPSDESMRSGSSMGFSRPKSR